MQLKSNNSFLVKSDNSSKLARRILLIANHSGTHIITSRGQFSSFIFPSLSYSKCNGHTELALGMASSDTIEDSRRADTDIVRHKRSFPSFKKIKSKWNWFCCRYKTWFVWSSLSLLVLLLDGVGRRVMIKRDAWRQYKVSCFDVDVS